MALPCSGAVQPIIPPQCEVQRIAWMLRGAHEGTVFLAGSVFC